MASASLSRIFLLITIGYLAGIGNVFNNQVSGMPTFQSGDMSIRYPTENDTYSTSANRTATSLADEISRVLKWWFGGNNSVNFNQTEETHPIDGIEKLPNATEHNGNSTMEISSVNSTAFNENNTNIENDNFNANSSSTSATMNQTETNTTDTFATLFPKVTNMSLAEATAASSRSEVLNELNQPNPSLIPTNSSSTINNNDTTNTINKILVITQDTNSEPNQTAKMDMEYFETSETGKEPTGGDPPSAFNNYDLNIENSAKSKSITTIIAVIAITDKRENQSAPATISATNTSTFLFKHNRTDDKNREETFISTIVTGIYANVNDTDDGDDVKLPNATDAIDHLWLHTKNKILRVFSDNNITYEEREKMAPTQTNGNDTDKITEKMVQWNYLNPTAGTATAAAAAAAGSTPNDEQSNQPSNMETTENKNSKLETTESNLLITSTQPPTTSENKLIAPDDSLLSLLKSESTMKSTILNNPTASTATAAVAADAGSTPNDEQSNIEITENKNGKLETTESNLLIISTYSITSPQPPTTSENELIAPDDSLLSLLKSESRMKSTILNNSVAISITIYWMDTVQPVPPTALIKYYPNIVKISWRSQDETHNNTIILMLKEEKKFYIINEIVLNLDANSSCVITKIPVDINPETFNMGMIKLNADTWIQFSNLDFLWKPKNIWPLSEAFLYTASTSNTLSNLKITVPAALGVIILTIVTLNLMKWRRQIKNGTNYEHTNYWV